MSDLLNKNKKIDRIENQPPKGTFNPNNIFVPEQNKKDEIVKEKTTSIRLTTKNRDKLKALMSLLEKDSIDQVLDVVLTQHETTLSKDKKKDYDTLLKIYSKKK
ncbi:hypothetical protein ACQRXC_28875 (plasmid) [Niallia taxi]|uniref:hypothetical protein n=1 Tax=Niallia TaxID=2837506 RepID=UPI0015F49667|nr:hypothetical protein [Niallia taxi]MED4057220.1 hypothetical protein [Niallia taxi]MED4122183.1 hypothetical protein [Niallia taxi]